MNYQKIYDISLSILGNPIYQSSYIDNAAQLLINLGVTDAAEQQAINNLLMPATEFRLIQQNTFKQRMDYNKKLQVLIDITNNEQHAALFQNSPENYLSSTGILSPEEQQQIAGLLLPLKQFQQIFLKHEEERMNYKNKMACFKAMLENEKDAAALKTNPQQYLSNFGIMHPEDQQEIISLLMPAQKVNKILMENAAKQYEENNMVNSSYRDGLAKTNKQTIQGFKATMIMYNISFYLGIALVITAVVFAFVVKSSLFAILFGSIGTLDLLTFFIANPPLRLQQSRGEQAKLNAAFYSWFIDLFNWNSFFLQYSQKGQVINFEIVKQVSDAQIENTRKLMEIISSHINTEAGK